MVDDGSLDETPVIMDELSQKYENFRAIHIYPNSGQSAAMDAGFHAARGEFIATLDGDGQNDPHDILRLFHEMKRQGKERI
jgi:glycosyltransferase involved in cell wall biosynthesis